MAGNLRRLGPENQHSLSTIRLPYALIIENKIYAADQWHQLTRYNNYAKDRFQDYRIVYLTLDGHQPSEESADEMSRNNCVCLSYHDHILFWLDRCIANSNARVGETVKQYRDIVKLLTNQTNQMEELQELLRIVKKYPQEATLLLQNIEAVQQFFIKDMVLESIKRLVEEKGWQIEVWNEYISRPQRKGYPHWWTITPTGWKEHRICYEMSRSYQIVGITGATGEKLPCCSRSTLGWKMGFIDTWDLTLPSSLPSIISWEIASSLRSQIANLVDQATIQAEGTGILL